MSTPVPPRQIANGLDAWAKQLHGTVAADAARDMRRAATALREQADEIEQLKRDLATAQQVVVDLTC